MKHLTVLAALSLLATTAAIAQPTFTASNSNPIAGETFYGHTIDTTGKQKGAAGANVTWTITGAATDHDTTSYLACSATPNCDSFAGSNLAGYNNSDYTYYTAGTNSLSMIGADAQGQIVHFTDALKVMSYPTTYNTTLADTGYAVVDAGIAIVHIWTINTAIADAWGTLTTPAGTFNNVLRLHNRSINKDSVNVMGFPQVNESATEIYTWYVPGFHNPLLSMTYDTSGTGVSHLTEVKYFTGSGTTAVNEAPAQQISLQVYPTPASDHIDLRWDGIGDDLVSITLTDMTGKTLVSAEYTNKNSITLPVHNYSNGMYLLNVRGKNQSLTQKVVISR